MDHEYDVSGGYVPSFVQHLKDTAARLGLRVDPQANEDQVNAEEAAKPHALSSWTPAEQDVFFRAVSVHSRWRPDLIAACVPTKTEWEVWMYLEALEVGAAALAVQGGGEDVEMEIETESDRDVEVHVDRSTSDSRSPSSSDLDVDEDLCEPALEVSQAWTDAEERMAAWIIKREHLASVEGDAAADPAEADRTPPKRKRGRPRKARGETVSKRGSSPPTCRSRSPEPTTMSTRRRSRDPDSSIVPERQRAALMGCLGVPHLLVLDSILREDEEATKERSNSREDSVTAAPSTEHGDDGAPRARDVDVSRPSDRITGLPGTSNVLESPSDVVIDPVLLALSGGVGPTGRQSIGVPSQSTGTGHTPAQGQSLFPNTSSQPGTSNTFTVPQDNAAPTNPVPNANAELELSFSPRSRRRIQKRLYMRRKRALLRGDTAAPGGTSDAGIKRLKPGKKAKAEWSKAPVASTSVPCSEAPSDSDAEAELPENVVKKSKPGLTLPYKLKAQFTELGVDAAYLRGQGMDLLNLSALGRLMGLYSSLEHGEEEADGPEFVDAQLIRYLQATMVSFVTDVMHRAIVWREREIRLKQRSRVWRQGDQFTIGAVEHAVAAIGGRYHSHKAYFKSLEAFHGLSTEASSVPGNATEELNASDASVNADVGAADLSAELPGLSPHRDAYTPPICPPPRWRMSPLACLTRTYDREATRTRRGTSTEIDEDELMSDETDSEALDEELEEEEKRDARDSAASATHEEALWAGVRVNK